MSVAGAIGWTGAGTARLSSLISAQDDGASPLTHKPVSRGDSTCLPCPEQEGHFRTNSHESCAVVSDMSRGLPCTGKRLI